MRYEAVVVGAGHNGLVAAFYLARAGLKTLVLERRHIVGGCCVTEEFAPGCYASTGAYVLSLIRPAVLADLALPERGLVVDPGGPTFHIYDDDSHLYLRDDIEDCRRELAKFSSHDADAYPRFLDHMERMAAVLAPLMDVTPPDLTSNRWGNLRRLLKLGRHGVRHRIDMTDLVSLLASSARNVLDRYFESDQVKAAFAWHALNDSSHGPTTPGSAFVLIHDAVSGSDSDAHVPWGFVRGGMGRVTELMAEAAREAGAEIRLNAEVESLVISDNVATGVRLIDGEVIDAETIVSNADPIRTLFGMVGRDMLPEEVVARLDTYRINGTSIKINLAVDRLPMLNEYPNDGNGPQEYHRSIVEFHPSLDDMERGADNVKYGRPTYERMNIEMCFPTVHDPSLAPEGVHVVTIDSNTQPYRLRDVAWDDIKDEVADAVLDRIEQRFPGLKESVRHRQVLSPLDMERLLGITGGHALHGDMAPDQLFFLRPLPGSGAYETPIGNLYLCGAGTHPGGGVTGANGRNCAREILRAHRPRQARALA